LLGVTVKRASKKLSQMLQPMGTKTKITRPIRNGPVKSQKLKVLFALRPRRGRSLETLAGAGWATPRVVVVDMSRSVRRLIRRAS
jgi:hypothetical protein